MRRRPNDDTLDRKLDTEPVEDRDMQLARAIRMGIDPRQRLGDVVGMLLGSLRLVAGCAGDRDNTDLPLFLVTRIPDVLWDYVLPAMNPPEARIWPGSRR